MSRKILTPMRAAYLPMLLLAFAACEIDFEPEITPLILATAGPFDKFGNLVAVGTLTDQEIIGTVEAFPTPLPIPTPDLSANRAGDPSVSSYVEVWCGEDDKVCYELCFRDECGIYDVTSPRVAQFIGAVDLREDEILSWESEGRGKLRFQFAAFVSCGGTLLGAAPAYAILTAADPEPISKTLLAVGGVVVAAIACGASLFSLDAADIEQGINEAKINKQTLIAEQAFGYLRDFGEEVNLNE